MIANFYSQENIFVYNNIKDYWIIFTSLKLKYIFLSPWQPNNIDIYLKYDILQCNLDQSQ